MGRDRFWFGAAICCLPFLGLRLTLADSGEASQGGPIDGHITIHGRPVTGGFLVLYPDDGSCPPISARIDDRGAFYVPSRRLWKPGRETKYRITIWPKARRIWTVEQIAAINPELKPLLRPQTSNLTVRLGDQPATIEIHL